MPVRPPGVLPRRGVGGPMERRWWLPLGEAALPPTLLSTEERGESWQFQKGDLDGPAGGPKYSQAKKTCNPALVSRTEAPPKPCAMLVAENKLRLELCGPC